MFAIWRQLYVYVIVTMITLALLVVARSTVSASYANPAKRLQQASEYCLQHATEVNEKLHDADENANPTPAYVRCVATALDLWTDAEGYNPKRVAKLFDKQHLPQEVQLVTNFCNQRHRQADLDMWAYEAYRCATVGRLGIWVREYMNKEPNEQARV